MITLPQLKSLAKQNNIRCTGLNKDEIILLLIDKDIITTSDIYERRIVNVEPIACRSKDKNEGKYEYLKGIRNNPKKVEVFDRQTNETNIYTSKYKAGHTLGFNPTYFKDGSILKNRYHIKVGGERLIYLSKGLKLLNNRDRNGKYFFQYI